MKPSGRGKPAGHRLDVNEVRMFVQVVSRESPAAYRQCAGVGVAKLQTMAAAPAAAVPIRRRKAAG